MHGVDKFKKKSVLFIRKCMEFKSLFYYSITYFVFVLLYDNLLRVCLLYDNLLRVCFIIQ